MALVKMTDLLQRAEKNGVGCGAFNVGNMEMVRGVIRAAEETDTPVIMQIAEGRLAHSPLHLMGPMMVKAAEKSCVDIAVHLDHGKTEKVISEALEMGFTSVMFDGSSLPMNINIEKTCEVVEMASQYEAAVEGELGHVGGSEGDGEIQKIKYTNPDDAVVFCHKTGVDALAVAIGNEHGKYICKPKLNFSVLEKIRQLTEAPLVLHGGSGISEDDFKKTIKCGIRKVNIATSNFNAMVNHVEKYMEYAIMPDYFSLSEVMVESVYKNVKRHIEIFSDTEK